jgi:cell division protein FtsB
MSDWSTLNNTLEEELRRELITLHKENHQLKDNIKMLQKSVAEEQKAKYEAYKRIHTLISESKLAPND